MSIYSQKCFAQNIKNKENTLNAVSVVRTLYARCVRAVSTLQQFLARRKSVMDAVETSCGRCKDVVCSLLLANLIF